MHRANAIVNALRLGMVTLPCVSLHKSTFKEGERKRYYSMMTENSGNSNLKISMTLSCTAILAKFVMKVDGLKTS